jgi:hypothetical protein
LVPTPGSVEWNEPAEALCRDFAALDAASLDEPRPETLLAFANAHGWLGLEGAANLVAETGDGGAVPANVTVGEPLKAWHRRIYEVRCALEILSFIGSRSDRHLEQWIDWHGLNPRFRARLRMPGPDPKKPKLTRWLSREDLEFHGVKDTRDAAHVFALQIVNDGLEAHTGARLLLGTKPPRFELGVKPSNLLGAIWLQVAHFAQGQCLHKPCAVCSKWMAIEPGVNRADRTYCGDVCRSRALRRRRADARKLRAEGATVSGIAKALESDAATVRRWLKRGETR